MKELTLRKAMKFIVIGLVIYLPLQAVTIQTAIFLSALRTNRNFHGDSISMYDARFSHVRNHLGSTHDALGYLGCPHLDIEKRSYHYFLTQYSLSPITVVDSLDQALILGNFPSELCDISSLNLKHNQLTIVEEYGDGIFLLARGE